MSGSSSVIVIGGGIAGLSIGWRLAQAGTNVTLLERGETGRGATWAAAGMIAVAGEQTHPHSPEAELAHKAQGMWPEFARDVEEQSGLCIDYRRNGSLLVATTQEAAKALQARVSGDVEWIESRKARALEPMLADTIGGALWAPNEAQVDPRKLTAALHVAFEHAGGVVRTGEEVLDIQSEHEHVVSVRTQSGLHKADAFVLAAGAWSGVLEARFRIRPIKGEIIALQAPAGAQMPEHVVWGNKNYVVPRGDRLIAGATMEDVGFDTQPTQAAAEQIFARVCELMPSLKDWPIIDHWAGLRPRSPDFLPLLGPTGFSNLFAATGQYRNGILFAPAIADMLTHFVMGRAVDAPHFDPRRFG